MTMKPMPRNRQETQQQRYILCVSCTVLSRCPLILRWLQYKYKIWEDRLIFCNIWLILIPKDINIKQKINLLTEDKAFRCFGHAVDYFYILVIFEIFGALVITKSRQEKSPWGRKLRVLRGRRWEEINFLKETFICSPTVCTGHNWAIHFLHTKHQLLFCQLFFDFKCFSYKLHQRYWVKCWKKFPC